MRRLTNCLFLLLMMCGAAVAQAPMELRCENAINPRGIKVTRPQLSWTMNTTLTLHGYQILVASSEEKLKANEADLWDSGKVLTYAKSVQYKGKPLTSLQRCYWKVRIFGNYWSPTFYSEPASWQMGVLSFDSPDAK
jgi:alpha-L-rhamnosidase